MRKSQNSVAYCDNFEKKKVLITGADGYIGSKLTQEALKAGWIVIATDITCQHILPLIDNPSLTIKKKDLLELTKEEVKDVHYIFHLASLVGSPLCDKNPREAQRVNLFGTEHLLSLSPHATIFFTNTNIGYPEGKSDETAPLIPTGVYSETKIEAEKMILSAGGISLRLASVCGISTKMRDDLLLNFLVHECVTKNKIEVFDVYSMRNFIHIKDVVNGLIYHHKDLRSGEAYNLAISTHYTKFELLSLIKQQLDKPLEVVVGHETDPDKRNYQLSVQKWYNDTKAYPKITIKEAIRELIKYYEVRAI